MLQLCFICYVHYTSFTCDKRLLKSWDFKNILWIWKLSNFTTFKLWMFFWVWAIAYYDLSHFTIKIVLLKRSLNRNLFYFEHFLCNCSSSKALTKTKLEIELNDFLIWNSHYSFKHKNTIWNDYYNCKLSEQKHIYCIFQFSMT